MENTNYRAIQLPIEAHRILKKYCDINDLKLGKTIAKLIKEHLTTQRKMKVG